MSVETARETHWRPLAASRPAPADVVPETVARLLGVGGIVAIAIVHLLDAADTYAGTRYVFWLYVALIAAAIPAAMLLVQWRSPLAWMAAGGLALLPLVGYIVSRSVGLPGDSEDIGNWIDTLGMVSLFVETAVLTLSVIRFTSSRRPSF
jgi:hypothetical protein